MNHTTLPSKNSGKPSSKTVSNSFSIAPWRRFITFCLVSLALCLLAFTVDLSRFKDASTSLTLSSYFLETGVKLPFSSQKSGDSGDFLTELVCSRYPWLTHTPTYHEEVLSNEREISLLPATPFFDVEVQEDPQPSQTFTGNWIQKTMEVGSTHILVEDVYVANSGKVSVSDVSLPASSPVSLEIHGSSPQILIYHSHGTESYSPTPDTTYEESDPFRTLEEGRNILTVGEAMATVFEEAGYGVIHDKNLHDFPDYTASYGNSSETLSHYLALYPSIELIFDVHRDALTASDGTPYQLVSNQNGEAVAQVMLVVGTNGGGFSHPNWRDNLQLALAIQMDLLEYGDFARPISIRSSRFNQHLSTGALLVEVGGHGNTLAQAILAGELFAESVVETMKKQDNYS